MYIPIFLLRVRVWDLGAARLLRLRLVTSQGPPTPPAPPGPTRPAGLGRKGVLLVSYMPLASFFAVVSGSVTQPVELHSLQAAANDQASTCARAEKLCLLASPT